MSTFNVPTREEVSANNQAIFDNLQKGLGFVPNLYAAMAHSENALGSFMQFSGAATSLSKKEKEAIDLAVSQLNECRYCQSAHTAIAKMNGFTDEQAIELRKGGASWDAKLNTLTQTARALVANQGKITAEETAAFYAAGYTKGNLVDIIIAIGVITVTNYLHNATDVAIDFPVAPEL
ncbi:carboxymuconolactone decarboxylase family protein [Flavobacterium algicola]|uniref:carboxymuconolactone decarboxylase family protein n=1 Tax=Flavobacterium algicola TaxID=556529 RepID=UPI001EFDEB9B|nr:carboxymuconolactone decarboxylase family protein [Flavobacterium algicola]MCG9794087.1 carboxymuconolactone decarboxylase family protein [Flavobacterium algicola]